MSFSPNASFSTQMIVTRVGSTNLQGYHCSIYLWGNLQVSSSLVPDGRRVGGRKEVGLDQEPREEEMRKLRSRVDGKELKEKRIEDPRNDVKVETGSRQER
jgi:hypothetical protein